MNTHDSGIAGALPHVGFGRTNLSPAILGLGSGGHSKLGKAAGAANARDVVRAGLGLGVTLIDTSEYYGTEEYIGEAIDGAPRGNLILCSKFGPRRDGRPRTESELEESLHATLRRLRTDYLDVYMAHGVLVDEYEQVRERHVPFLLRLREQGKIRWIGITEQFASDTTHRMLTRAVHDDVWDVVMVGYNMLNLSATARLLPRIRARSIATLCMFAVRKALKSEESLRAFLAAPEQKGSVGSADLDSMLCVLNEEEPGATLADIAYRFARDTGGLDVILCGTGNVNHLKENVASIQGPPLSARAIGAIRETFGGIESLSGQ